MIDQELGEETNALLATIDEHLAPMLQADRVLVLDALLAQVMYRRDSELGVEALLRQGEQDHRIARAVVTRLREGLMKNMHDKFNQGVRPMVSEIVANSEYKVSMTLAPHLAQRLRDVAVALGDGQRREGSVRLVIEPIGNDRLDEGRLFIKAFELGLYALEQLPAADRILR